jgi:hypothetical protein
VPSTILRDKIPLWHTSCFSFGLLLKSVVDQAMHSRRIGRQQKRSMRSRVAFYNALAGFTLIASG